MIIIRFLNRTMVFAMLVFLVLAASTETIHAQNTERPSPTLQEHLNAVTTNYIELKNALVNSNSSQVSREALEFWTYLNEIEVSGVEASAEKQWVVTRLTLMRKLDRINKSENILQQRKIFSDVTTSIEKIIAEFGRPQQLLFEQYCPSALGGKGATWLSEKREILNPYSSGDPGRCGEIVDTLGAAPSL